MTPAPAAAAPPRPIPFVCYAVVGVCVAVFLVDALFTAGLKPELKLFGPAIALGQAWRPFTSVFVHGDALHLVMNMMGVMSLGREVENAIGTFRFLITSIVGAMGSAAAVLIWNFEQPAVGASGMICAWAGAFLPILDPKNRRQLLTSLLPVALISFLPGVSGAGHVGGFLFGLPCGLVLRQPRSHFQNFAPVLLFVAGVVLYLAGVGWFRGGRT